MVLVGQGSLLAQLPVARLLTVFPPGGKVGETNGLPEANKFLVTIATNVTPGVYEARVVGRFGISNPRSFVVSDLPETIAPATNNSPANAAAISLDTIINGHAEADAVGFFKF